MPTESAGAAAVAPTSEGSATEGSTSRTGFTSLPLWGVVVAAALVLIVAGLRETADIIAPIFLIITLVITVQPLRRIFLRWRFPSVLASVLVLLVIFLMMSAILGAVALSVTQLVYQLPRYEKAFLAIYDSALELLAGLGVDTSNLPGLISQIDIGSITGAAQSVLQQILSGITSGFSLFGLMVLTAIFMAFDAASVRKRLAAIARQRPDTAAAFYDFGVRVRRYWVVTTVFGLIVAVIDVIALLIIGVPLAITWGILAFVSNYIPNVGFVIGLIPPTLIALLDGGPGAALAVLISYAVINFVIQTLIQPRFTGDAAGINATVAFISLIFWASILGVLGALLAVPATLFVKVILIDHSPHARWFGALISSDENGPQPRRKSGDSQFARLLTAARGRIAALRGGGSATDGNGTGRASTEQAGQQEATEQAATKQPAIQQAATKQAGPEHTGPEQAAPESAATQQKPSSRTPTGQKPSGGTAGGQQSRQRSGQGSGQRSGQRSRQQPQGRQDSEGGRPSKQGPPRRARTEPDQGRRRPRQGGSGPGSPDPTD